MNQDIRILPLHFLADGARDQAAALYWQAFQGKLGRLLGRGDRALPVIRAALDPGHALAAVTAGGTLVGVAGFRSAAGSFVSLSPELLRRFYGPAGSSWRLGALRLLGVDTDNERFLIDGLSVSPAFRSQGIGRALLEELASLARAEGYRAMRLDVAESNPRARALYERCGFRVVQKQRMPFAAPVFGVWSCNIMERRLSPSAP
ncbi:GNAT family N-acetyltransferase [Falsigemmobacter faecalis]|uniref:GNAT family N-acetyltransferase n=1 Tax=Falsigemmobacter faecalis TaxID=2488730 RepID=UPI0013157ACD|nr:GNAT family N-acetyltransferase [Falsigemmobacter faecalis]